MLKINVGFNRKVGEANYSSRGASVNLELELDSSLVSEPDRLRDRVRQMFLLAKSSVDDELNGGKSAENPQAATSANAGNGNGARKRDNTRGATASQVRAIHAIADRQGVELTELLHGRYGIDEASQLSITEASQLIDELKGVGNGTASSPGKWRPAMIIVAPVPNQVAYQLTGRDYISYSALSLYQQCPLRYYFKYVAGLPERIVSASLVFGGAIHAAIEHHYRELLAGSPAPDLDALLGVYQDAWQAREPGTVQFGKEDNTDTLNHLADRMLRAFLASELAQPAGHVIGVEEELRGAVIPGCPDLLGRIDLLVGTADEIEITDLKTARSRWSRDQVEDSSDQLLLYSELVRPLAPDKSLKLQFAVLTKTKEPSIDLHRVLVDRERIKRTKRIAQRIWRAIEAGNFYPAPSPMNCPSCPFREPCRKWQG